MSDERKQPKYPPTQQGLEYHCASQSIELSECQEPEFRLELVEGKFLVGGTIEGSRWLLKEALIGWGLEAAIAFTCLDKWWEALRVAYEVPYQSPDEWLVWAEDLPLCDYRLGWYPPIGSRFKGEHRFCRDNLRQALSAAVSLAGFGTCFGPNYGMQLGADVFTPDLLMVGDLRLAENTCHDCYMKGSADLAIEIVLPEVAQLDEQLRRRYYEQGGVQHYWIVNPVTKQILFWQWSTQGYQLQSLDPDGCYRGVPALTFSPELFWSREKNLPAFTSTLSQRRWELRYEEGGVELDWGSIPFTPIVDLQPHAIQAEQFIAWCPETKLESGPLIGGGEVGTRNAIAMLLMSLGLVETVKLMPGYEWVRVLRRIERQQQKDAQRRQEWWHYVQTLAQRLQSEYQVGGVGIIGDLTKGQPLNFWSQIHLIVWEIPEKFEQWRFLQKLPEHPRVCITQIEWATSSEWHSICQEMTVLIGQWQGEEQPRKRKHMQFYWLDDRLNT